MSTGNHGGLKLFIKGTITALILVLAICCPDILMRIFTHEIAFFKVYHLIWLLAMVLIAKRLFPGLNKKISMGKIFDSHYAGITENNPAKQKRLETYVRKVNAGAVKAAFYWLLAVLFVGILYYTGVMNRFWLTLTVVFFIFMDQFCVSVWCVFQWIIGTKCCNTCRINNWGYLMAFSTLIFLPSFWTYSILFLSALVVAQWEYLFYKYPERFYEVYNTNLQCRNCEKPCKT